MTAFLVNIIEDNRIVDARQCTDIGELSEIVGLSDEDVLNLRIFIALLSESLSILNEKLPNHRAYFDEFGGLSVEKL